MSAPSMEERKTCWGARDEYWKCLDDNAEDTSRCQKFRCSFESKCPQQWHLNSLLQRGLSYNSPSQMVSTKFLSQPSLLVGEYLVRRG
uniref:Cytochrome c oxidase assembly factor 6 homolog n=1 Tax=Sphenodon punctatus TaxID=8508 RepID=A0A8D0HCI5_SPHPU